MKDIRDCIMVTPRGPTDGRHLSQSTVSLDLEPSSDQFKDVDYSGDVDSSRPATREGPPVMTGNKVLVSDIFKNLKPVRVRDEQPSNDFLQQLEAHDLTLEDPIESYNESPMNLKQTTNAAVNLRTLLDGGRGALKPAPPQRDGIEQPMEGSYRTGITTKNILNFPGHTEVVDLLSSDVEESVVVTSSKRTKNQNTEDKSLIVRLKYTPYQKKIARIESMMRSTASRSVSAKELLRSSGKKDSQPGSDDVKDAQYVIPLRDTASPAARSLASVLTHKQVVPKHSVSKLKYLAPPTITADLLHVKYGEPLMEHRTINLPRRIRSETEVMNFNEIGVKVKHQGETHQSTKFSIKDEERSVLASKRVPEISGDTSLIRFSSSLANEPSKDTWTTMFRPHSATDVLWNRGLVSEIELWINNSFKILKRTTKRHTFSRSKRFDDEMDDFIVDEEDDQEETEDEKYTPLMILSGPSGVGKTSGIYAMMEDRLGYVYEINASQARGRKDILTNVRELSTTQLVHKQNESTENLFQEGVILFDDVDVLFESDKNFWSVVEDVLRISRRPIILTCADPSEIPASIMECAVSENSYFEIKPQSTQSLCHYLYLCGLVHNCDVDEDLLKEIVKHNEHNLSRCLLALEMLCKMENPGFGVTSISQNPTKDQSHETTLSTAELEFDLRSLADQISTSSFSLINHEHLGDEMFSHTRVLNEGDLKSELLPFEMNIAQDIFDELPPYPEQIDSRPSQRSIRNEEKEFSKSKIVKKKRLTRNTTRQMFDNMSSMFTEHESNTSILDHLAPNSYFTDVSPMIREFARFDYRTVEKNIAILKSDPEHRPAQLLAQEGLLYPKLFNRDYCAVLYAVGKNSGMWM